MDLTGLEIALGGVVVTGISVLGTWAVTSARYQTRTQCDERHAGAYRDICDIRAKQSHDTGIVMRMLRAIIVHSDIPEAEKERILNDRSAQ